MCPCRFRDISAAFHALKAFGLFDQKDAASSVTFPHLLDFVATPSGFFALIQISSHTFWLLPVRRLALPHVLSHFDSRGDHAPFLTLTGAEFWILLLAP